MVTARQARLCEDYMNIAIVRTLTTPTAAILGRVGAVFMQGSYTMLEAMMLLGMRLTSGR